MSSAGSSRLLLYVCGIYLQLDSYSMVIDLQNIKIENRSSWVEAFQVKPDGFELISPSLAEDMATEIREKTLGPVYVSGFTYGKINVGGVIQMTNSTEEHKTFCASASEATTGFFYTYLDKRTYDSGRRDCFTSNSSFLYLLTIKILNFVDDSNRNTWFWMDVRNITTELSLLVQENKAIYCMVLDFTEDDGTLKLDFCNRSHNAVYVKLAESDAYQPIIKRYTDSSVYPFYQPRVTTKETTTTSIGTSGTLFSTGKTSSNFHTKSPGGNGTVSPESETTDIKDFDSSSQDILGMNPDIFYTLAIVASLVLVTVIICCLCCCFKKRRPKTKSGLALSNEYSNPVDSIAMKDPEMGQYPNNGVYANPQDSISPVKAKKRDSIEEGVYDVTFTSGQRKHNTNQSDQPVNAYSHVTIVPQGGASVDEAENQYDCTSHVKQQQKVLISHSHSDNTYGEVQIKKTS